MEIYRGDVLMRTENPTPGERHRLDLLTERQGARMLAGHLSILPPGQQVPDHYHRRRESLLLFISGEATEIVDGQAYTLKAGDLLYVGAGERHRMENRSEREVRYLEFFSPIERDVIQV